MRDRVGIVELFLQVKKGCSESTSFAMKGESLVKNNMVIFFISGGFSFILDWMLRSAELDEQSDSCTLEK